MNINLLINDYFQKNKTGIETIYNSLFEKNQISLSDFISESISFLNKECSFIFNKDDSSIEEINIDLFYHINEFAKNKSLRFRKIISHLCPGCLFLNKSNIIFDKIDIFNCNECIKSLSKTDFNDFKRITLFKTFSKHLKKGYRCQDCKRFIPHPLDDYDKISCPYFDCCFVGSIFSLKVMRHPSLKQDFNYIENNELVPNVENNIMLANSDSAKFLQEIINNQINNISYHKLIPSISINHKIFVYQAISNLLKKYPQKMTDYLLHNSRSGGFQHKIFQEYIKILEESFPLFIIKNNQPYKVDSLLDSNLCLFDGVSVFKGIVNDKLHIKNGTHEFYIGGRKASYTGQYYIGKLLSIIENKTKKSLINHMAEYSFSKIKMQDIEPGTEVIVSHLRMVPHYQMGGMVYVNRVRKSIVDQAKSSIYKI